MARPKKYKDGFDQNKYYEQNKERINRRRRERYKNNAKVRDNIQERNKEYYATVSKRRPKQDRRVITSKGSNYYSMGVLASKINREPQTVREYHRNGMLPEPSFHDSRGWRLYTRNQIILSEKLFREYDSKKITKKQLKKLIKEGWDVETECG